MPSFSHILCPLCSSPYHLRESRENYYLPGGRSCAERIDDFFDVDLYLDGFEEVHAVVGWGQPAHIEWSYAVWSRTNLVLRGDMPLLMRGKRLLVLNGFTLVLKGARMLLLIKARMLLLNGA